MKVTDTVGVAISVTHQELVDIVKRYYKAKKALFIWGPTGVGKSTGVRQAAREIAAELNLTYSDDIRKLNDTNVFMMIDIRLAQNDPSDLRGIPVFDKEKHATVWLPPETFPRTGHGIIFLDEFPQAPPLVQASAFQLVLDRRIGSYVVPDGYMIVAAGNRLEDRAATYDLPGPLKNRFGHVELQVPTVEQWTKWAAENGIDFRIIAFLQFKRTALFGWDPKLKENAFPTPRSWEHCSLLIKGVESLPLIQKLAATQVGLGTATELVEFIKVRDKLKPMQYYLKDPEKCELPNPAQLDLQWALVTSIAEYYREKNDRNTLASMLKLLKRFPDEYTMFCLKLMASVNPRLQIDITRLDQAGNQDVSEIASKLTDFFE